MKNDLDEIINEKTDKVGVIGENLKKLGEGLGSLGKAILMIIGGSGVVIMLLHDIYKSWDADPNTTSTIANLISLLGVGL